MNSDSHQIQALKNRYKSSLSEKAETIGEHLEAVSDSDQVDITKLETVSYTHLTLPTICSV